MTSRLLVSLAQRLKEGGTATTCNVDPGSLFYCCIHCQSFWMWSHSQMTEMGNFCKRWVCLFILAAVNHEWQPITFICQSHQQLNGNELYCAAKSGRMLYKKEMSGKACFNVCECLFPTVYTNFSLAVCVCVCVSCSYFCYIT